MFTILKPDTNKCVYEIMAVTGWRNLLFQSLIYKSDVESVHLLRTSAAKWIGLSFNISYYPSISVPMQKSSKVLNVPQGHWEVRNAQHHR